MHTRDTARHCDLEYFFFEAVEDAYLPTYLPTYRLAAIQVPMLVFGVDHCATFRVSQDHLDTHWQRRAKNLEGAPFMLGWGTATFF